MTTPSSIERIEKLILEHARQAQDWALPSEWNRIRAAYQALPELQQELAAVRQSQAGINDSPRHYAIFLGRSPDSPGDLVVGLGSTRLEVRVAPGLLSSPEQLTVGQEVILNRDQNTVIGLRDTYLRGETAEVVNLLKPAGAAEVLALGETAEGAPSVRVAWREGEKLDLGCPPELAASLRPGDLVRFDGSSQMVVERLRPRLHVRSGGSDGVVVEVSDALFAERVAIGDIVRIEPALKLALEKLPAYETGGLSLEEVPDVTYEDIAGLDTEIEQIYDAIELPYLYRAQFERFRLERPKGILLTGPPGCGKTMVAKAVANNLTQSIRRYLTGLERLLKVYVELLDAPSDAEAMAAYARLAGQGHPAVATRAAALEYCGELLRAADLDPALARKRLGEIARRLDSQDGVRSFFLNVKGPELLNKYVGETEHRIRKIFEEARERADYYTPVIIFFDEMEAMFRTRGSGRSSDVETTIVPQFLTELDGVEATANLIIIGASNRQDMIDPAILRPGRLDVKVKIDRPDADAAREIFALYLLPTLPLMAEGLVVPAPPGTPGAVVFRTAYRLPADEAARERLSPELRVVGELLPFPCDLRLIQSLGPALPGRLARLPAELSVAQALARHPDDEEFAGKLGRFRSSTPIGAIVAAAQELQARSAADPAFATGLERLRRQEWLAEALIDEVVELMYSSTSAISVLTRQNTRYRFPLKEFASGAVIANIVARAKKQAVKELVAAGDGAARGLGRAHLFAALRQEFEENREQLALHKLRTEMGLAGEELLTVDLHLERFDQDPWAEEKVRQDRAVVVAVRIESSDVAG